jgi:hypothetical protein
MWGPADYQVDVMDDLEGEDELPDLKTVNLMFVASKGIIV